MTEADIENVVGLRALLIETAAKFASTHNMPGYLAVLAMGEVLAVGMCAYAKDRTMGTKEQAQLLLDVAEGLARSYAQKMERFVTSDTTTKH